MITDNLTTLFDPVYEWQYIGAALHRGPEGTYDADITGDPCIVWDDQEKLYRMFYFAMNRNSKTGNNTCNAMAVNESQDSFDVNSWKKIGPVNYTNPEALKGGHTHKPWILMDPYKPNMPACVNDHYMLFTVSYMGQTKVIQAAVSEKLSGAWTVWPEPVFLPGKDAEFDAYHTDTVTAYWFEDRNEILIFYKGYPAKPQPDQPLSPWGSSLAAAVMHPDENKAEKIGKLMAPSKVAGHWLSGWASGIQIFPSANGGWLGLMTASPSAPVSIKQEPWMREPAPSLAGWAYTENNWPISGWQADEKPIWNIDDIPPEAKKDGMCVNLWRHHMLVTKNGDKFLFCNSGRYGQEKMFVRKAVKI